MSIKILPPDPTSSICDGCKEPPEPFKVEAAEEGEDEIDAYYHIIDLATNDPTVLMASGEICFRICTEIEHPVCQKQRFLCAECFVLEYGDEDEDEDEDE